MFKSVLEAVADGAYVMLKGDAGSGKTYGAVQIAKALDLDYRIFSFTNEISLGRCIGYMDAMGKYVKTSIREMYENGGLLILDEFDAMNPNVAVSLNNMLSGDEYTFPDAVVAKHADFKVIACTNTFGRGADKDYSSRNKLDFATLDRFDEIFDWGYDEDIERQIFGDTDATNAVFAIRKNARNLGITITPRRTKAVNRMVNRGVSLKVAVERAILVAYKKDQQRAMLEGVRL
jgi:MoxR-like ATPase